MHPPQSAATSTALAEACWGQGLFAMHTRGAEPRYRVNAVEGEADDVRRNWCRTNPSAPRRLRTPLSAQHLRGWWRRGGIEPPSPRFSKSLLGLGIGHKPFRYKSLPSPRVYQGISRFIRVQPLKYSRIAPATRPPFARGPSSVGQPPLPSTAPPLLPYLGGPKDRP